MSSMQWKCSAYYIVHNSPPAAIPQCSTLKALVGIVNSIVQGHWRLQDPTLLKSLADFWNFFSWLYSSPSLWAADHARYTVPEVLQTGADLSLWISLGEKRLCKLSNEPSVETWTSVNGLHGVFRRMGMKGISSNVLWTKGTAVGISESQGGQQSIRYWAACYTWERPWYTLRLPV